MASTSASATFYTEFQALKADVASALDASNLANASGALGRLRTGLAVARASLPPYDQRSYDLQVKDLETRLAALRADKPKAKFTFAKRSASSTPRTATPPTPPVAPAPAPAAAPAAPALPVTTYTLSSQSHTRLTPDAYTPAPGSSYTLTLSDLTSCVIDLRPSPASTAVLTSLHARDLRDCVVLAPPMAGSAMLSDVTRCVVLVGAQQFRLHTTRDTVVMLYVPSLPVIEGCDGVMVGAYPGSLGDVPAAENQHDQIQDFDWVRGGPSPHWRVLTAEEAAAAETALLATASADADAESTLQSIPCIQSRTS